MDRQHVERTWPAYLIAGVALSAVMARLVSSYAHQRFDSTSLTLLVVAGIALLVPYLVTEIPRLRRIKYGSAEVEFADLAKELPAVSPGGTPSRSADKRIELRTSEDWNTYREEVKQKSRDVFLAHVIRPSSTAGQKYDIFVLLARTQPSNLEDVAYAEFFFGKYWGSQVFKVPREGERIGVWTSAYGPFLATCRVTFTDGYQANIERLIDFEMGRLFEDRL
jgi:hypothetical protein